MNRIAFTTSRDATKAITGFRHCSSARGLDDKAFREGKGPNPASQDTATCVNELPAERES